MRNARFPIQMKPLLTFLVTVSGGEGFHGEKFQPHLTGKSLHMAIIIKENVL
jgi:hypothetical protein